MNRKVCLALLAVAIGLSACSGSFAPPPAVGGNPRPGVDPDPVPPSSPASPWTYKPCESTVGDGSLPADAAVDGIWQGTLTNELRKSTEPYTAIVDADGRFALQSTGHTQLAGMLAVDGRSYTGEGLAHSGGLAWADGSVDSALSVAGVVAERDVLSGEFMLEAGDAGCFQFTYDATLYEQPSSPGLVAGQWSDVDDWGFTWLQLDISDGGVFAADGLYGCRYEGGIVPFDAAFNLYAVNLEITQRPGDSGSCIVPGSYEGLAYLTGGGDPSDPDHALHMSLAAEMSALRIDLYR